jgi:hypothetical protein
MSAAGDSTSAAGDSMAESAAGDMLLRGWSLVGAEDGG